MGVTVYEYSRLRIGRLKTHVFPAQDPTANILFIKNNLVKIFNNDMFFVPNFTKIKPVIKVAKP
jgi:hypothetical protein